MSATSLIIGGTKGIGSVISASLNKRGDNVFTVSRNKNGHKNHIQCDITKTCKNITSTIDKVDYLIFSHRYRGNDWSETFDVTVQGINNVITEVSSIFSKNASVVIISSNASKLFIEGQSVAYHSSRSALLGLMRSYAVKYGKNNIRFNCISPATLIKPENVEFFSNDSPIRRMIEKITPLGRMGDSSDIANLVEFLCSDKSSFITGGDFFVDGGLSIVGQESIAKILLDYEYEK
jgi:NAD(P)-dependent dehydrogenase (short-subunit alcohol dehydrogenase family)